MSSGDVSALNSRGIQSWNSCRSGLPTHFWNTASVFSPPTLPAENPRFFSFPLPLLLPSSSSWLRQTAVPKCCDLMRGNLLDLLYKFARGSHSDKDNYIHHILSVNYSKCLKLWAAAESCHSTRPPSFGAHNQLMNSSGRKMRSLIIAIWSTQVPSFIQLRSSIRIDCWLCRPKSNSHRWKLLGRAWSQAYLGGGLGATVMIFQSRPKLVTSLISCSYPHIPLIWSHQ